MYLPWLYPGTLNIVLTSKKPTIEYFDKIDTHYGRPCKIANCKINGELAFIVLPPMANDRKRYVEIGAEYNLRNRFTLVNGDTVEIEFL
jgi:CTP-dependent riboflavin kinase